MKAPKEDLPRVRTFTKDNPCTKLHLWNCFRGRRGFVSVPVVSALAQIGKNAPMHMRNKGYLQTVSVDGIDYYSLTLEGRVWLHNGTVAFIRNHPDMADQVRYAPRLEVQMLTKH